MEYISVIKDDLDLSSEHRYLRVPHPRTGVPQLYLPSSSRGRDVVLEVAKIQCSRRRTWFIGDSKVDAGTILMHYELDPLFLAIPVLLHLINSHAGTSPPPFQPLEDLISTSLSSSAWSVLSPFTKAGPNENPAQGHNEDMARLLGIKSVRRAFKLGCEKKVVPGVPSSPPSQGQPSKQVYYRPSLARIVVLLQTKVNHLAEPERFEQFDHFVRALGREGMLSEETDPELLRAARIRASCEHLAQWLPLPISSALQASYDFSALSEFLANRAAVAAAASAPIVNSSKDGTKAGTKRKAPPASRGVEALKKVNTSSMSKLTSFFKPKEAKK